jgi:hypothetical protein
MWNKRNILNHSRVILNHIQNSVRPNKPQREGEKVEGYGTSVTTRFDYHAKVLNTDLSSP